MERSFLGFCLFKSKTSKSGYKQILTKKAKWKKTKSQRESVCSLRTLQTTWAMKTMVHLQSNLWQISMRPLHKLNSMKKPNKFSNGPRRKELFTTLSSASPDQEASQKNNKLSSAWTISLAKVAWIPKEIATSTPHTFWKEKEMDPASLQEDSDKLATPELTQFGISNPIFYSETATKPFTFQHFWFLIMDMLWTTRLCSELAREPWARVSRDFWKNLELKTAVQSWLWVWNKNFSPFQEKLTSKESTSDPQAELWSVNFQPNINNSQTITTERFPMRLKTFWKKLKMSFWNWESRSRPDTMKSPSINLSSVLCSWKLVRALIKTWWWWKSWRRPSPEEALKSCFTKNPSWTWTAVENITTGHWTTLIRKERSSTYSKSPKPGKTPHCSSFLSWSTWQQLLTTPDCTWAQSVPTVMNWDSEATKLLQESFQFSWEVQFQTLSTTKKPPTFSTWGKLFQTFLTICTKKTLTETELPLTLTLATSSKSELQDHLKTLLSSWLPLPLPSQNKQTRSEPDLTTEKVLNQSWKIFTPRLKTSDSMAMGTAKNGPSKPNEEGFTSTRSSPRSLPALPKPQKSSSKLALSNKNKQTQGLKSWSTITWHVLPLSSMPWFKFITNTSFPDALTTAIKTTVV